MPKPVEARGRSRRGRSPVAALVAAVAVVVAVAATAAAEPPKRVVSINLCTDQLALALAAPGQVAAVSRLSLDPNLSDVVEVARDLVVTDGTAEEIVPLAPDLVLAGAHTSRATVSILRRLGHRVEEFAPPRNFADIRASLFRMGELLDQRERAAALVAAFDRAVGELRASAPAESAPLAVVYHVGQRAEGRGTIAHDILVAAGWRNLAAELGIEETGALPLEVVLMHRPDVVLVGAAEADWLTPSQPNLGHPAVRSAFAEGTHIAVMPDRWIVCGNTSVTEVVRRLVYERRRLAARPRVLQ